MRATPANVSSLPHSFIAQLLFVISTAATKASILLFYRRMAKDTYNPHWRYAIWAALAFTGIFFVALIITYCFICQPLSSYWLSYNFSYDKPYKCINGNILSPLVGSLGILSDLYATFLPWTMLQHYDLDVPRRQKIALNTIFSLSLIVAGCGGGRLYYLWKMNHTYDTSWTGYDLFVWSTLECHLAVIFACAPSLRAFFRRYMQEPLHHTFRRASDATVRNDEQKIPSVTASAIRDSGAPTRLSAVMNATPAIDKDVRVEPAWDKAFEERFWEERRSSETVPRDLSAGQSESYDMVQLRRHGHQKSSGSMLSHAQSEASMYKVV